MSNRGVGTFSNALECYDEIVAQYPHSRFFHRAYFNKIAIEGRNVKDLREGLENLKRMIENNE